MKALKNMDVHELRELRHRIRLVWRRLPDGMLEGDHVILDDLYTMATKEMKRKAAASSSSCMNA